MEYATNSPVAKNTLCFDFLNWQLLSGFPRVFFRGLNGMLSACQHDTTLNRQMTGPCGKAIDESELASWEAFYDGSSADAPDSPPTDGNREL